MRQNSFQTPTSSRSGKVFRNSRFNNSNNRPKRNGQYIDPSKFVNRASGTIETEEVFIPQHNFSDFGLLVTLQNTLRERSYLTPTPIQDGALKPALAGGDVIGLANTGTGKTAAFVLPIIQRFKTGQAEGMSLILAPTHELAAQIDAEFKSFAKGLGLYSALCVGGANIGNQIKLLSRRPQVVIGTPGRLKDLFNQGYLPLSKTSILVLDEFDRMLDMGFIRDIRFLLDQIPEARQTLCFSATVTPDITQILSSVMKNPTTISVRRGETSEHIEQDVIEAGSKEQKLAKLIELLRQDDFDKVLVFGQTKWSVQRLSETLNKEGFRTEAIHGNKSQSQRARALASFKNGQVAILVATDVAARGLDIPNVSHVINFDIPTTYDDYVHRIGRTGRAGASGKALTFVTGPGNIARSA
ncbi:MAG: DEAD/DEAH box helicase [Candidatus Saccharimonadia bacterium]